MVAISRRHLMAIAGLLAGGALASCGQGAQTETARSPNAGDGDASQAQTGGEGAAAGTSEGEAVFSQREGEQLLVIAKVLDSPRLVVGSYVLVTFRNAVADATVSPGTLITWISTLAPETLGYISAWDLRVKSTSK